MCGPDGSTKNKEEDDSAKQRSAVQSKTRQLKAGNHMGRRVAQGGARQSRLTRAKQGSVAQYKLGLSTERESGARRGGAR